jgi:uncharacterized membrane protein (GlpM family)
MGVEIQAILGGAFVGFILWLSRTRIGAMAGLLLFFPIISVPTFFFLGSNNGDEMRQTILWSFWAIPVWVLFALTLYYCSYRLKIFPSMMISLIVWFISAAGIIYLR